MAVVFTTWRVCALPLFLSLMAPICPVVLVGWACSWQPGGPDAAPGAPTVVTLYWWLLMQGYVMVPGLGGKISSPGASGRPMLTPMAHSCVLQLLSWMLCLLPGMSIQWAAQFWSVPPKEFYSVVLDGDGGVMAWEGPYMDVCTWE